MRSPQEPDVPIPLLIQRLMDADLVQPEHGLALLAEIETWSPPSGREDTHGTEAARHPSLVALDALAQADWGDASAMRAALDRALALVKQSPGNLGANAAETSEPRD